MSNFLSRAKSLGEIREFFVPGRMFKVRSVFSVGDSFVMRSGDHFLVLSLPEFLENGDVVYKVLLKKKGTFDFTMSCFWNYSIFLDAMGEKT